MPIPIARLSPVCRYYYIIFADIIAVTATLAATIHYIYSRSLLLLAATLPSLIIFAAVIAIAAAPVHYILATARCDTAAANAARATVAYHHCREYNRHYVITDTVIVANTIAADVIANAIAAVISTAVAATVSIKF